MPSSPRPSCSRRVIAGKRSCPFDSSSSCVKKLLKREISACGNRSFNCSNAQEKFRNFMLQVCFYFLYLLIIWFSFCNVKFNKCREFEHLFVFYFSFKFYCFQVYSVIEEIFKSMLFYSLITNITLVLYVKFSDSMKEI